MPPWPLVLAVLLSIGIAGVVGAWRNSTLDSLRPWATGLVAAGILAVVLDLGVADPHTAWLVHWLNSVFPPYRGMMRACGEQQDIRDYHSAILTCRRTPCSGTSVIVSS